MVRLRLRASIVAVLALALLGVLVPHAVALAQGKGARTIEGELIYRKLIGGALCADTFDVPFAIGRHPKLGALKRLTFREAQHNKLVRSGSVTGFLDESGDYKEATFFTTAGDRDTIVGYAVYSLNDGLPGNRKLTRLIKQLDAEATAAVINDGGKAAARRFVRRLNAGSGVCAYLIRVRLPPRQAAAAIDLLGLADPGSASDDPGATSDDQPTRDFSVARSFQLIFFVAFRGNPVERDRGSVRIEGAFGPVGSLFTPRTTHGATYIGDDLVLITGGFDLSGRVTDTAEIWDGETSSFRLTESLTTPRAGHTAIRLDDGRVLLVGGRDEPGGEGLPSMEVFDPTTESFEPLGSLATPRADHTATQLDDGRVVMVGGVARRSAFTAAVEVLDLETASIESAGSLATPRSEHTATLLADGRIAVVGGAGPGGSLDSVEIFDPATRTFETGDSLAAPRASHSAVLLDDGRLLVIGGDRLASGGESLEIWDPGTLSSNPAGLPGGLRPGELMRLPEGDVLFVADWRGGILTASAESLENPRVGHTTTVLPDGRVLVVGGLGIDGDTPSAHAWEPLP